MVAQKGKRGYYLRCQICYRTLNRKPQPAALVLAR